MHHKGAETLSIVYLYCALLSKGRHRSSYMKDTTGTGILVRKL